MLQRWANLTEYVSIIKFQRNINKEILESGEITAASLDGNVLVIFSLLAGGLFVATFGFLCEVFLSTVARMKISFKRVIDKVFENLLAGMYAKCYIFFYAAIKMECGEIIPKYLNKVCSKLLCNT